MFATETAFSQNSNSHSQIMFPDVSNPDVESIADREMLLAQQDANLTDKPVFSTESSLLPDSDDIDSMDRVSSVSQLSDVQPTDLAFKALQSLVERWKNWLINFPKKILFESRRKKWQRFLSLSDLTVEKIWWPLFTYWLTNNFEPAEVLYIAIDRTQWSTVNLIVVSLIYDKRAIPIYFEILPKLGNSNVEKQIAVLSKVLPLLNNYKKVVLGDREFCGVDLAQWLKSQPKTYFCLCLRRNEYIEIAPGIWRQLQELGVNPGISIYLSGVKLSK